MSINRTAQTASKLNELTKIFKSTFLGLVVVSGMNLVAMDNNSKLNNNKNEIQYQVASIKIEKVMKAAKDKKDKLSKQQRVVPANPRIKDLSIKYDPSITKWVEYDWQTIQTKQQTMQTEQ